MGKDTIILAHDGEPVGFVSDLSPENPDFSRVRDPEGRRTDEAKPTLVAQLAKAHVDGRLVPRHSDYDSLAVSG
jgi:hypothetical protein